MFASHSTELPSLKLKERECCTFARVRISSGEDNGVARVKTMATAMQLKPASSSVGSFLQTLQAEVINQSPFQKSDFEKCQVMFDMYGRSFLTRDPVSLLAVTWWIQHKNPLSSS